MEISRFQACASVRIITCGSGWVVHRLSSVVRDRKRSPLLGLLPELGPGLCLAGAWNCPGMVACSCQASTFSHQRHWSLYSAGRWPTGRPTAGSGLHVYTPQQVHVAVRATHMLRGDA